MPRRYHIADVFSFLYCTTNPDFAVANRKTVNSEEYQEWFRSGVRECAKHEYLFMWHAVRSIDCPKCKELTQ